jgi:EmrB/QacA subfamily drug resistance transporter
MKLKMDYKWVVLSVTTVGSFMASLDSTIVTLGLPTILKDINASIVHGIWIITGYSLMMTILAVVLGHLADIYGRVRLYNLGFAIFTIGSLLCALSRSGEQLVIFRLLQGSGAALLAVNSVAIITDAFPKEKLGMALGTNIMAMNLGAITGYTLGGVMITIFGWQSIFLINVPIGIFGTIWGYMRLRAIATKHLDQKFDYAGSILYCVGLTTILLGLTLGNPLSLRNILIIAAGLAFFIAVIFIELRLKFPTLDLTLFKIRAFAAGNFAAFLNFLAFGCGPFLRSLFVQMFLGYSAFKSGHHAHPAGSRHLCVKPDQRQTGGQVRQPGAHISGASRECRRIILVFYAESNLTLQRGIIQSGTIRSGFRFIRSAQYQFYHGLRSFGETRYCQWYQNDAGDDRRCDQRAVFAAADVAGNAL